MGKGGNRKGEPPGADLHLCGVSVVDVSSPHHLLLIKLIRAILSFTIPTPQLNFLVSKCLFSSCL